MRGDSLLNVIESALVKVDRRVSPTDLNLSRGVSVTISIDVAPSHQPAVTNYMMIEDEAPQGLKFRTEVEKEQHRKKYSDALKLVKTGESIRKAAERLGLQRTTLSLLSRGMMSLEDIANPGRKPFMSWVQEEAFIKTISEAATRGEWKTRDQVQQAAYEWGIERGNIAGSRPPPSRSSFFHMQRRHPEIKLTARKVAERGPDKTACLTTTVFNNYFQELGKTFKLCDYSGYRADCGLGVAAVPASAVCLADEVALTAYHDGSQWGLALRDAKPAGNTSGGDGMHITLMYTYCLAGYVLPGFVILSHEAEIARVDRNLFVGLDPDLTITSNETGSMKKSIGHRDHPSYHPETFQHYVSHIIKHLHLRAGLDKERHKVILITDHHSSRDDISALDDLRNNNIILKTIPPGSSWILQGGDTRWINKKINEARRSIVSGWKQLGVNVSFDILLLSLPAMLSRITPLDIFHSAIAVGFYYDPNSSMKRLVMTEEAIQLAIEKFRKQLIPDDPNSLSRRSEEKNKIFDHVQQMKSASLIPNDIDPSLVDPDFVMFLKKILEGGVEASLRDLPPTINTNSKKVLPTSGSTLTGREYITLKKRLYDEEFQKQETASQLRKRKLALKEALASQNIKLGVGKGGPIHVGQGFVSQYLAGSIELKDCLEIIVEIRAGKRKPPPSLKKRMRQQEEDIILVAPQDLETTEGYLEQ
jgi:hypothetical protein